MFTSNPFLVVLIHVVLVTLEGRVGEVALITSHHETIAEVVELVL